MKKQMVLFLMLVALYTSMGVYADAKSIYIDLLSSGNFTELKTHLEAWEKAEPNDPEMFIGFFNYYITLARSEEIIMGGKNPPKDGTVLSITDPQTGERVGFIYGEVQYDQDYAEKALHVINRGLKNHPRRLDMHFGKTRLLAELKAYTEQKDYILLLFSIGKEQQNQWLWSDSKAVSQGEEMFIEAIHDYIYEWVMSGNEIAFENVKVVSEYLIQYFPKNTIGYNDNAIYYANKGDLITAEKQLLAAHQVNPADEIIISNLAYFYQVKKNIPEAKKYYTLLLASSDENFSGLAKEKLAELTE